MRQALEAGRAHAGGERLPRRAQKASAKSGWSSGLGRRAPLPARLQEEAGEGRADEQALAETDILLELMASKASPLYRSLMDAGLINPPPSPTNILRGRATPL